jgi:hypothetical protein
MDLEVWRNQSMLNTILRKRAQVLAAILVLSVVLIATTAFAATEYIKAKRGGIVPVAPGVSLVIKPGALAEDTVISANMKVKRNHISFCFGPSGTVFSKPAELCISWQAIDDVEDLTLYGEDGEGIEPAKTTRWGVKYYIEHFSMYYFRRR